MSLVDASGPWVVVLALVAVGVATFVFVFARARDRRRIDTGVRVTRDGRETDPEDGGGTGDDEPSPRAVVFPSNDTTGGLYLDDPARAGWDEPVEAATGASEGGGPTDGAPPSQTRTVTVSPETVTPAQNALEAGDVDRAVDRAYHAVRDELTARAGFDAGETPREFVGACRTAFDGRDTDAIEALADLYERTDAGDAVSPGVVGAILDRLTGREGRHDRDEW